MIFLAHLPPSWLYTATSSSWLWWESNVQRQRPQYSAVSHHNGSLQHAFRIFKKNSNLLRCPLLMRSGKIPTNPPEGGLPTVTFLEVLSSDHKLKVWQWSAHDMIQNVTQQQGKKRFCTESVNKELAMECLGHKIQCSLVPMMLPYEVFVQHLLRLVANTISIIIIIWQRIG